MYGKLSIVIPIYNELENVKNIVRQLDSIGKDNFEVIFVDGYCQSDSDLFRYTIGPKYKYIKSSKVRGLQINKGFEMAKHDLVLFLHCDSAIELTMVDDITNSANRGVQFGCISIFFNDSRPLMKICGFMSRFRTKKRKIAFGD